MEVYVCTQIREFISGIWGPNFILTLIWTYPDGARQFRHYAPRRRAPIWTCTEKFEFLDLVDFGGVSISVKSVIELLFENW